MNPAELVTSFLNDLLNPSAARIMLSLIMFGYVIRMIPWIENRWIPMLNCFLLGPFLSFVLLGWPSNGEIEPACRWPEVCAYVVAYQRGFLVGVVAWMMHGFVLKKIEEALQKITGEKPPIPPPEPKP